MRSWSIVSKRDDGPDHQQFNCYQLDGVCLNLLGGGVLLLSSVSFPLLLHLTQNTAPEANFSLDNKAGMVTHSLLVGMFLDKSQQTAPTPHSTYPPIFLLLLSAVSIRRHQQRMNCFHLTFRPSHGLPKSALWAPPQAVTPSASFNRIHTHTRRAVPVTGSSPILSLSATAWC